MSKRRKDFLGPALRARVLARDRHRCRWCGRVNVIGLDPHHIRYRRSSQDDVESNLISLCRGCHDFVHGAKSPSGDTIPKDEVQDLLWALVDLPGATGMALRRQRARVSNATLPRLKGDDDGRSDRRHDRDDAGGLRGRTAGSPVPVRPGEENRP